MKKTTPLVALPALLLLCATTTSAWAEEKPTGEKSAEKAATQEGSEAGKGEGAAAEKPKKKRLLVLDAVDKGAGKEISDAVSQTIQDQALKSFVGDTITLEQLRVTMDAAALQQAVGCDAEGCMLAISETVEADQALGGNVAKVGDGYLLTLIHTETVSGKRLGQEQRKIPDNADFVYYAARDMVSRLLSGRGADPTVPMTVRVSETQATVLVDGKDMGMAPLKEAIRLDPGVHEVRVRKEGFVEWRSNVTVEEGTPLEVKAVLTEEGLALWPAGAITAGIGLVAVGAGLTFGAMAQDAYDGSISSALGNEDARNSSYLYQDPVSTKILADKEQDIRQLELGAYVLYGTGAVLGAAGVALITADFIMNE
jgi:hypothetical protein